MIFNNYHYKCYQRGGAIKLMSVRDGQIKVQSMLQIEMLGWHYGINKLDYLDANMQQLYNENSYWFYATQKQRRQAHIKSSSNDGLDDYYEALSEAMEELGCERAMFKCQAKAHILKYRGAEYQTELPRGGYAFLYAHLKNLGYRKEAEKLYRFHISRLYRLC